MRIENDIVNGTSDKKSAGLLSDIDEIHEYPNRPLYEHFASDDECESKVTINLNGGLELSVKKHTPGQNKTRFNSDLCNSAMG